MRSGSEQYRMLVLDLDGTVVRGDGSLAPADVAAARALMEAGVAVTIATGRIFSGTIAVARELGVEGLVACANGSELVEAGTGEVRQGYYLDAEERTSVREVFHRHGLLSAILTTHDVHYDGAAGDHASFLQLWSRRLVAHAAAIGPAVWRDSPVVSAIVGLGAEETGEEVTEEIRARHPALETLFVRGYDGVHSFVKVRRAEVDKGTALASMAESRGLSPEQVVAVGDWHNDTPMLHAAGHSFVVRGAPEDVRAAADETLEAGMGTGGTIAEVAARVWGVTG